MGRTARATYIWVCRTAAVEPCASGLFSAIQTLNTSAGAAVAAGSVRRRAAFFSCRLGSAAPGPWVLVRALLGVRRIDWKSDLRARTLNELLAGSVSGEDGIELEALGALGALGMEGTRRRVWAMTRRPEKKRFE